MRVDIDFVDIVRFRSYTKQAVLDFAEAGPGLHFIHGINKTTRNEQSNGAGKSSIFNAICWCLYGKTIGGLKQGDVAPWSLKKRPDVAVGFTITHDGKSKQHTVVRVGNKIAVNGKDATQETLFKLLGCSFNLLVNTALHGQGRPLFLDLEPRQKLDLFTGALGLDRWDARSTAASKRAAHYTASIPLYANQISGLDSEAVRIKEQMTRLNARAQEWEEERTTRDERVSAEISDLEKRLVAMRRRKDDADLENERAGMRLKELRILQTTLNADLTSIQKNFNDFSMQCRDQERQIAVLEQELAAVTTSDGRCSTCGQSLRGTALEKHQRSIAQKIKQLKKENTGIPSGVTTRLKKTKTDLKKCEDDIAGIVDALDDKARSFRQSTQNVAEAETRLRALQSAKQERDDERNPYKEQIPALRTRLAAIAHEQEEAKAQKELCERRSVRAQYWVKGFKQVKLYQIEEVLNDLEMTTNAMLPEIGLDGWEMQYSVERETKTGVIRPELNVTVLSPFNDKAVKWEAWSGGEAQRLRIVGSLALSEVLLGHAGIDLGFEILDEPTRGLSPEGITDLCTFLADRAKHTKRQIFLLDQHAIDFGRFRSITEVVRDQHGSKIVKQ
jgi:DNA repair exonuclease SbcCD ATPase subunit